MSGKTLVDRVSCDYGCPIDSVIYRNLETLTIAPCCILDEEHPALHFATRAYLCEYDDLGDWERTFDMNDPAVYEKAQSWARSFCVQVPTVPTVPQ